MDAAAVDRAIEDLDTVEFWKKGYAVLPGMYTPDEVEEFRRQVLAKGRARGDLLADEEFADVLTDGRMIRVAQKLLDTDEIVYMGDSSVTLNSNNKGWHKDNTDRMDPDAPDWNGPYTQLRFGVYLQDHVTHTGGLNLRVGSHDIPNLSDGELLYLQSVPGDLAVWSMRITHSGNGMLLKDPDAPFPDPAQHKDFGPDEVAPADGDRIAIFAHLGADDEHAARYAEYLKTRRYIVSAWRAHPYTDEVRQAAAAAGLRLRDMPAEVANDPGAGLNDKWEPFPYERDGQIVTGTRQEQLRALRQAAKAKERAEQATPAPVAEPTASVAERAKAVLRRTGGRGKRALRGLAGRPEA